MLLFSAQLLYGQQIFSPQCTHARGFKVRSHFILFQTPTGIIRKFWSILFRFAGIFLKSVSVLEQERQKSTDRWKGLFFLQIFYILFLVSFFFYLQQIGTGTYSTRCIQTCYPGQVSQFTLRVLLGKNQCFESGFRIRIRVFYDTKCEIYQKLKNNKRVDWKNIFFFHFLFSSSNFSNPLLFTMRIFWD